MGHSALFPQLRQGRDQVIHISITVQRRGCKPQTLSASWNGRVINRLNIDAKAVHQIIGQHFGFYSIFDHHRHDMAVICQMWNPGFIEPSAQTRHLCPLTHPLYGAGFEMRNRGARRGCNRRRQGRGKNESRAKRPDKIAHRF